VALSNYRALIVIANAICLSQSIELFKIFRDGEFIHYHRLSLLIQSLPNVTLFLAEESRLKEEFQLFWMYDSRYWVGQFLDKWCTKTMRLKIGTMKKVAKMLRRHRLLLLN
jgi:hypothetical protein